MPIMSEVKFGIPAFATPDRVKEQWAEVLGVDAVRINQKAQAVINGEAAFSSKLASPSSVKYNPMIAGAFVSKSGKTAGQIVNNQRVNLARSYDKWADKMDFQYETIGGVPAARFKDVVNASKDSLAAGLANSTLPLTGIKVEARGLIAMAGMWLTGDTMVEGMIRGCDNIIVGGAYRTCKTAMRFQLRTMLASQLVYVGAELIKCDFESTLMATLNQLTAELVQGMTDPGLDLIPFVGGSPDSFVDYKVDPVLGRILHIRISKM